MYILSFVGNNNMYTNLISSEKKCKAYLVFTYNR